MKGFSRISKGIFLLSATLILAGCNQVSEEPTKTPEIYHVEKENITTFDTFKDKKVLVSGNKISVVTDTSFGYALKFVKEGERYLASFKISTTGSVAYAFADDENNVISYYDSFTDNYGAKEYYRCSITAPRHATCLYINCDSSYLENFDLLKLTISDITEKKLETYHNIDKKKITIAANNTGEFDYGNTDYTTAEYKQHWNTMLTENKVDFFSYEDLRSTYLDGTPTKDTLGSQASKWIQLRSFGEFFSLATDYEPISSAIVPLPYSVGGKTSKRFIAVRNVYLINRKITAIYTVHLVAEGHISKTINDENGKAVNYLSQQLRQNQFHTLIMDTKAYDEAIVVGDFNAQDTKEYQTWVNAGFNIANGSEEFGSHVTLIRDKSGPDKDKPDVPADNIITTKGIKIKSFKLLDTYNLNTDHRPVVSELEFGE